MNIILAEGMLSQSNTASKVESPSISSPPTPYVPSHERTSFPIRSNLSAVRDSGHEVWIVAVRNKLCNPPPFHEEDVCVSTKDSTREARCPDAFENPSPLSSTNQDSLRSSALHVGQSK